MTGCQRETAIPQGPAEERVPQQVLQGVVLRQTSLRGLLWILEAERGLSYGPEEPLQLETLKVRFYDGEPRVKSVLTSRRGTVDDRTRLLVARDSVVVVTAKGERLETDSLRWDPRKERIATEAPFRLTRGGDVLTGIGIEADPDLVRYSVRRQVRAEVRDQDDREILEALDGDTTSRR